VLSHVEELGKVNLAAARRITQSLYAAKRLMDDEELFSTVPTACEREVAMEYGKIDELAREIWHSAHIRCSRLSQPVVLAGSHGARAVDGDEFSTLEPVAARTEPTAPGAPKKDLTQPEDVDHD
jgi:hypothetical protein